MGTRTTSLSAKAHHVIRVALADRTRMNCQLLTDSLQRSSGKCRVVATAISAEEVRCIMRQQHPEVVLVSPQLSDGPLVGFDLVQEMRESSPAARAIMLLDAIEPRMVINAFQVGAKGVFSRDRSVEALAKCIELVHDGQIWVSTNELHMILQALAKRTLFKPQGAAGAKLLTDREAEVATLVAEGLKNYEIAERMQLSAHTVKNYLYRVYEKLGIYSRVELTARVLTWARREDQERSPSGSERLAG